MRDSIRLTRETPAGTQFLDFWPLAADGQSIVLALGYTDKDWLVGAVQAVDVSDLGAAFTAIDIFQSTGRGVPRGRGARQTMSIGALGLMSMGQVDGEPQFSVTIADRTVHSFTAPTALIRDALLERGIIQPALIRRPAPAPRESLYV